MALNFQGIREKTKLDVHSSDSFVHLKIPGSPCFISTPSDLSEPPDIKKWFSSYVYESPVLDTEDELKGLDSEKSGVNEVGVGSEEQKHLGTEVPNSPCSLSHSSDLSEPPDIKNWFSSYVYESPAFDTEDEFKCSGSEETNQLVQRQPVANISDDESFGDKPKETNGDCAKKLETEEAKKRKSRREEADIEPEIHKVNKTPLKIALSSSNCDGSSAANGGFVCTKKNKYTNENDRSHLKKSQEYGKETKAKLPLPLRLKETQGGVRKPLYETSNLRYEVAIPEFTGKWRCPQRSKPDLGPPLKQLRLERWVRRV